MAEYKCPDCDSGEIAVYAVIDCTYNLVTHETEEVGGAEWDDSSGARCVDCDSYTDLLEDWKVK
jgi:hypothetical protein